MSVVAKRLHRLKIKMPLDMEVGLGPGDFVLDGEPAPPEKGHSPQFSAHVYWHPQILSYVYCGQTAGWMKTPLGTEVDLGPDHNVLDGVPAAPHSRERGTAARIISTHVYCGYGR